MPTERLKTELEADLDMERQAYQEQVDRAKRMDEERFKKRHRNQKERGLAMLVGYGFVITEMLYGTTVQGIVKKGLASPPSILPIVGEIPPWIEWGVTYAMFLGFVLFHAWRLLHVISSADDDDEWVRTRIERKLNSTVYQFGWMVILGAVILLSNLGVVPAEFGL